MRARLFPSGRLGKVPDTLAWVAAALLTLLTLLLWWAVAFRPDGGLHIANHSGQILTDLSVCSAGGECRRTPRLWPHLTWQVPLSEPLRDPVRLVVGGQEVELKPGDGKANGKATGPDTGIHLAVTAAGRVVALP